MANINILYWNIEDFGKKNKQNTQRCAFIAEAAKSAEADVICLIELVEGQLSYLGELQKALNTAFSQTLTGGTTIHSGNWYYDWIKGSTGTAPYNEARQLRWTGQHKEGYAVFWNQNIAKFTMEPAAPVPTFDAAGLATGSEPNNTQSKGLKVLTTNGGIKYAPLKGNVNIPAQYTIPADTIVPGDGAINGNPGDVIPAGTFTGAAGITIAANNKTYMVIPGGYTFVEDFTLPVVGELVIPHHALNLVLDGRAITDAVNYIATHFDPAGWEKLEFTESDGKVKFDSARRPAFCTINPASKPGGTAIENWLLPVTIYHAPASNTGALPGAWRAALSRSLYVVYDRTEKKWKSTSRALVGGDYNLRFHNDQADPANLPALISTPSNKKVLEAYTKAIDKGGNHTIQLVSQDANKPNVHKSNVFATAFSAPKSTDLRKHQLDNLFHKGFAVSPPFIYGPNDEMDYGYLYDLVQAVLPKNTLYLNNEYPENVKTAWKGNFKGVPPATLATFAQPTGLLTGTNLFNTPQNAAQFIRDRISDHLPLVCPVLDDATLPKPDVSKTKFTANDTRLQYDNNTVLPLTTQVTLALKDKGGTMIGRPVKSLRLEITNGSFTNSGTTSDIFLAQQGNQTYTIPIFSPKSKENTTITVKAYLESTPIKTIKIPFLEKNIHFTNSLVKAGIITGVGNKKKIPLQFFLRDMHGNVIYSDNETIPFLIHEDHSNSASSFDNNAVTKKEVNAIYNAANAGQDAFYGVDLYVPAADPRAFVEISQGETRKYVFVGTPTTSLSTATIKVEDAETNNIPVGAIDAYIHIKLVKSVEELSILGNNHPPVIGQGAKLTLSTTPPDKVTFGIIKEIEDGTYKAKITVPTVPTDADFTITVRWGDTDIDTINSVSIHVASVDAGNSTLEITGIDAGDDNVYPITVGATATLQLSAKDLHNNPISGKTNNHFELTLPQGITRSDIQEPDANASPGVYTCTLTAAENKIGEKTIAWNELDGSQVDLQITVRLVPDQPHAGHSTLVVDKDETIQDGAVAVTIQLKDQYGNHTTTDQPVTLTFNKAVNDISFQSGGYTLTAVPESLSEYKAVFIYNDVGDVKVTVKVGGDEIKNKTVKFVAKAAENKTILTIDDVYVPSKGYISLHVLTGTAIKVALSNAANQYVNAAHYTVAIQYQMEKKDAQNIDLARSAVVGHTHELNGTIQFPNEGRATLVATITNTNDAADTFTKTAKFKISSRPATAANSTFILSSNKIMISGALTFYVLATIEFMDIDDGLTPMLRDFTSNYKHGGNTIVPPENRFAFEKQKGIGEDPDKGRLELLISSAHVGNASIDLKIGGSPIVNSPQMITFFDSTNEQAVAANSQMVVKAYGGNVDANGISVDPDNGLIFSGYQQVDHIIVSIELRDATNALVIGTSKAIEFRVTQDGNIQTVDAVFNPESSQYEADIFKRIENKNVYNVTATWNGNAIKAGAEAPQSITIQKNS